MKLGEDAVRGEAGAVEHLVATLNDADPNVRISAAQVMGRLDIEPEQALGVVMSLVDEGAPAVHQAALYALVYFSNPPLSLVPQLIAGLGPSNDSGEIFVSKDGADRRRRSRRAPAGRGARAFRPGGAPARGRGARRDPRAVLPARVDSVSMSKLYASPKAYAARARNHLAPAIRALLGALRDEDSSVRKRASEAVRCGAIDRIPSDILGGYLDALLATENPSACFAMADALASEDPRVVATAKKRWPALAAARQVEILEAARDELGAQAAERASRAVGAPG